MQKKPHVLIYAPWYEPAMDRLDEIAITHHLYEADNKEDFLAEHGPKCSVIGTMHYCPASLMDAVPNLKLILNFGVGYDGVDIPAATKRGVTVVNTPDVLNDCVADMALSLILAGRRKVLDADRYIRSGDWETKGNFEYVHNVHSSKIGILGLGRIGLEIANRCKAFKMDIAYHQRTKRSELNFKFYESLIDMAEDCEILVAIIPGGETTEKIIRRFPQGRRPARTWLDTVEFVPGRRISATEFGPPRIVPTGQFLNEQSWNDSFGGCAAPSPRK